MIFDVNKKIFKSIHGSGNLFDDKEIIEKSKIERKENIGKSEKPLCINFTRYYKAILQQQATRECTAAAAAMIILDQGGKVNIESLLLTNLGNHCFRTIFYAKKT